MSKIRIESIKIENYRSFGTMQKFEFPSTENKKPIAIVGYNNSGKTNLMNCILYGLTGFSYKKFVCLRKFSKN
jgi:AAA15 family ATPase/GTPase